MRRAARAFTLSFALALVAGGATAARAQSVSDVVNGMYGAIEKRAAGIDDYTIVQNVMGFETTTYLEKKVVDGHTVFLPRQTASSGPGGSVNMDDMNYGDLTQIGQDLIDHARYGGREQVEGAAVHLLIVDDLTQLNLVAPSGPQDMEFVAKSGRIYVDANTYFPRRMSFSGEATTTTGVHEITTNIEMLDYRETEGMLIPWRNVITIEGIGAMMDPEMQGKWDEMQKQLESVPESQRAMIEQMLGPQLEQMRKMMQGGGDAMTMEVTVTDVRVNTGPPSR